MAQFKQWIGNRVRVARIGLLLVGVTVLAGAAPVATASTEVREFAILVDNKQAGSYQMTLQAQDHGAVVMTGRANLSFRYLIYKYTYTYVGREVWKGGRLQSFQSATNDDGHRFEVSALPDGNSLRIKVNGKERLTRPDVWITSYWHLPEAKFRHGAVPLIDGDTGKDIHGRLQFIAIEPLPVGGKPVDCAHYRLTGGPNPVDLWYDGQERLVQESFVEQKHKTVISLTSVRR